MTITYGGVTLRAVVVAVTAVETPNQTDWTVTLRC